MSITDDQIRNYIQHIFNRYDRDRSGTLNSNEIVFFFNDLFQMMNNPRRVTQWEAQQAIRQIDLNHDGQASKQQLFLAFRKMLNPGPTQNYGSYGQQNQGWCNQPTYPQQSGWSQQPSQNQEWNSGYQGGYGTNYGYNQNPNTGWGNQPPQNTGWGQPSYNQGYGSNPQKNCGGLGYQQPNSQKNWGSGW